MVAWRDRVIARSRSGIEAENRMVRSKVAGALWSIGRREVIGWMVERSLTGRSCCEQSCGLQSKIGLRKQESWTSRL